MPPSFAKTVQVWQLVATLAITLVTVIAGAAIVYSRAQDDHVKLQGQDGRLGRIERNIARIGTALKVQLEDPKD